MDHLVHVFEGLQVRVRVREEEFPSGHVEADREEHDKTFDPRVDPQNHEQDHPEHLQGGFLGPIVHFDDSGQERLRREDHDFVVVHVV